MASYRTIVGSRRLSAALIVLMSCVISACGGGGAKDAVNSLTSKYTVGGSISGLSGSGLVLQDNHGDSLAVSGNGSFTFSTALAASAP
jgi:6-phosphogluconolactonase